MKHLIYSAILFIFLTPSLASEEIQLRPENIKGNVEKKQTEEGIYIKGSNYLSVPSIKLGSKYTLTVKMQLLNGLGYGIILGNSQTARDSGIAIQYDPGANGIRFIRTKKDKDIISRKKLKTDKQFHNIKIVKTEKEIHIFIDNEKLFNYKIKGLENGEGNLGFRVWGGAKAVIKSINLDTDSESSENRSEKNEKSKMP